jgi:hypothetical protein
MIPPMSTSHQAQSEKEGGRTKTVRRRNWVEEAGHKKQNGEDAANVRP